MSNRTVLEPGQIIIGLATVVFFAATTWASYVHWANFQYHTFDLAYYVQAIWQLIHGRFQVSVENVPLLGNHVEPIVFLFAPLLAIFRHPMVFVAVQNATLAAMGPVAYNVGRKLGLDSLPASLLAVALLLTPATAYVALHEFHPEALTAPLLILLFQARLARARIRYWILFVAVLACKENMALLLTAYCVVQAVIERKRNRADVWPWFIWPGLGAVIWFILCTKVITPALNPGNIDYLALYDRLGHSVGNILSNIFTRPQLIGRALFNSLVHGNLVWALLGPFLFLPLLRPRWILIAAPILLQHLLSWRTSEWTIFFHYSAPLLPLFWIALAEVVAAQTAGASLLVRTAPWLVTVTCVVFQIWLGPATAVAATARDGFTQRTERARKNEFISLIPADASVVAPLPYLSHLAMRQNLYSLHYILKGLKTLSRVTYEAPQPTDFVLIDYLDSATFDPGSGYYHPTMKTADGRIIPSSDQLLHDFLKRAAWTAEEQGELCLLKREEERPTPPRNVIAAAGKMEIGEHTKLLGIHHMEVDFDGRRDIAIVLDWDFKEGRDVFPWMLLRLKPENSNGHGIWLTKGLCAPETAHGLQTEGWYIARNKIPPGEYSLEALFFDNSRRAWYAATGGSDLDSTLLAPPIPVGHIKIER